MFNIYKKLFLSWIKFDLLNAGSLDSEENRIKSNKTVKLSSLLKNKVITKEEQETFLRVTKLLNELKEEITSWQEVSNEAIYVRNLVESLINSTGELTSRWIQLLADDWINSIYTRSNWENYILVSNEGNTITDQKDVLGDLNFTWYTLEESLIYVDTILNTVDEATLFNTDKFKAILEELKVAFRLKHAIMKKDELV